MLVCRELGMGMSKPATLLLIAILAVSSIITVKTPPASASITKPSVPEFTVQIAAYPYDVPTTHSIDPYTGADITHQGYNVENKSIEVKIKNQPFTPYWIIDSDGANWTIVLHYNVWVKGHFAENWNQVYSYSDGLPTQASGEYTVFSRPISYPSGSQVDFKVEAMAGYVHRPIDPTSGWPVWTFTGEESWSNIQTLTISDGTSTTPNPTLPSSTPQDNSSITTPSGTQTGVLFGLNWEKTALIVLAVMVAVLLVTVAVFLRKKGAK
jgi:hypothetical protein